MFIQFFPSYFTFFFFLMTRPPPRSTLFPSTTLFRSFEEGEPVKITSGPFVNFQGVIEEVNAQRGKVRITVSIFGRQTPLETVMRTLPRCAFTSDRKSTRLNSSHGYISYAVFCLKKKK